MLLFQQTKPTNIQKMTENERKREKRKTEPGSCGGVGGEGGGGAGGGGGMQRLILTALRLQRAVDAF